MCLSVAPGCFVFGSPDIRATAGVKSAELEATGRFASGHLAGEKGTSSV